MTNLGMGVTTFGLSFSDPQCEPDRPEDDEADDDGLTWDPESPT